MWAGLAQTPGAQAAEARRTLVAKAAQLFRRQRRLFGQINENTNGVLGVGSDSPRVRVRLYRHWRRRVCALCAWVGACFAVSGSDDARHIVVVRGTRRKLAIARAQRFADLTNTCTCTMSPPTA